MAISAAKVAQEKLIEASGVPYTIVRATQFLEFLRSIADSSAVGNTIRLPPVMFQPIAADDVAAIVAETALAAPRNGVLEIAGPERAPFNELVARYLKAVSDPREVMGDPEALYGGGRVDERSLVPLGRSAPRPHRSRRMASPLAGGGLIPNSQTEGALHESHPVLAVRRRPALRRRARADRTAASCGPAHAEGILADMPGKEMLTLSVEYPPGAVEHVHRHDAYAFVYVLEEVDRRRGQGRQGGRPDARTDFLRRPRRCAHGAGATRA